MWTSRICGIFVFLRFSVWFRSEHRWQFFSQNSNQWISLRAARPGEGRGVLLMRIELTIFIVIIIIMLIMILIIINDNNNNNLPLKSSRSSAQITAPPSSLSLTYLAFSMKLLALSNPIQVDPSSIVTWGFFWTSSQAGVTPALLMASHIWGEVLAQLGIGEYATIIRHYH